MTRGVVSSLIFGAAYAFASLSCSLPIFLLVVLQSAVSASFVEGLLLYLIYGLGAGGLLIPLVVATSLSKGYVQRKLMGALPYIRWASAAVLITAGIYMIVDSLVR